MGISIDNLIIACMHMGEQCVFGDHYTSHRVPIYTRQKRNSSPFKEACYSRVPIGIALQRNQRSRGLKSKVKWVKPSLKVMILAGGLVFFERVYMP